jgi:Ni/Co efflux regulator RcnB
LLQVKTLGRNCQGGNVELSLRRMRRINMIIKTIKTIGLSIALAAMFLVAAGSSTAFAQDERGRDRDREGRQEDRRERDDWKDDHRERFDERRGYRDGLILGREDALEHRRFNPFRHPRFRFGSNDYREAFRSGYARAYRRFADNYWFRFGRSY